jgi:hypothetical protein
MQPLFFIPGARAVTAELLAQHGLDRLLSSAESRQTFGGPNGLGEGILLADRGMPPDRITIQKDQQTWSPRFGYTSLIGTWNDDVITPESLQREKTTDGAHVRLLDGAHWLVPVLRKWHDESLVDYKCTLPRVMQQCAETGRWLVGAVVPQYRDLWNESLAIAEALFEQLRGSDTAELEWERLFAFAVQLLAVNYRIDASVLSHLELLQPDLAAEIVQAALDWPTLRATLKNALSRLASSGTTSESGATPPTAASITPTGRQSQN